MSTDTEFPKNNQIIGKHNHFDNEHFHYVLGPGRTDAETSINNEVQDAYKAMGVEFVG